MRASMTNVVIQIALGRHHVAHSAVFERRQPNAAFSFLSGSGADPTGKSRIAFARYKGEAENGLLAAGFPSVYLFRPAYIYPVQPRKEPNFSYRLLRTIYPAFQLLFPNQLFVPMTCHVLWW